MFLKQLKLYYFINKNNIIMRHMKRLNNAYKTKFN